MKNITRLTGRKLPGVVWGRRAGANLPQNAGEAIRRAGLPNGPGEWALELGMEGLGAAAAFAYGGPGAAAEEFALGAGGSLVGRYAGAALGAALGRGNPRAMARLANQGAWIGGVAGGIGGSYFGPRPFTDEARRRQEEEYLAQQQLRDQWLISQAVQNPMLQNYNALLGGQTGYG